MQQRHQVLITGASSGLGAEFARQLSNRSHELFDFILVAHADDARMATVTHDLGKHGCGVETLNCDLRTREGVARVKDLIRNRPRLNFVINNAGFGLYGNSWERADEEILGMIDLNVAALTSLSLEAARVFVSRPVEERRRCHILNIASTAAFQSLPFMNAYAASKAYVLSFSEGLRFELEPSEIGLTVVCPGPVDTQFWNRFVEGAPKGFEQSPFEKSAMLTATEVVRGALATRDHGGGLYVPGFLNRIQVSANRFAPRAMASKIAQLILKPREGR
jgi:short-subunit dehydrogenase